MKKIALTTLNVLVVFILNAQFTGKPIYNIRIERADTSLGNIEIELFPNIAPLHSANFDSIVNIGRYDSTAFHRVISDFMIQGGDPNSINGDPSTWGQGDPNQAKVNAEFTELSHTRGRMSAARSSDPNSASAQFFICHGNPTYLDGDYSAFGEAISGLDIVDFIANVPKDANDMPLEVIRMFITKIGSNDSVPDSPVLISPITASTGVTSSTKFEWNSVSTAKLYLFEIATDSDFNNVVFSKETKDTTAKFTYLTESYTNHYWRVRTNNGGKYSADDDVRTFENTLGTPIAILPINEAETGTKVFFDWSDVGQADNYNFLLSRTSTFNNPFLNIVDTIISNSEFKVNFNLELNKTYYWKIQAIQGSTNSDFSPTYKFIPREVSSVDNLVSNSINIYPNPVDEQLNIDVVENSSFEIYNSNGQSVYQTNLLKGSNNIDVRFLNAGIYSIQILNINSNKVGNFIKK